MIKVLADKYLFELESMLPPGLRLDRFDPGEGLPGEQLEYDAFLTRTVIPVNGRTLDRFGGRLRFVGTGSSGTDHVDLGELDRRGIAFADAAGCNARSVAEYVAVGLLLWCGERGRDPSGLEVGIVGAGHAGGAAGALLEACGIGACRLHDPPRAGRETDFHSCGREEVLDCDVVSLHLPLTESGPWATRRWLDGGALARSRAGLIINTARGGVADEAALADYCAEKPGRDCILDVWENEPVFSDRSARRAFLATPHIAGYSRQAKREASRMVARALCDFFGLAFPGEESGGERHPADPGEPDSTLAGLLRELHPARRYERRLKELIGLPDGRKAEAFNRLRSGFPLRNEFRALSLPAPLLREHPLLEALGFRRQTGG